MTRRSGQSRQQPVEIVEVDDDEIIGSVVPTFVFDTVFSDPVGDTLTFLAETVSLGYTVVLCYIGIARPALSEERVAMHLQAAIRQLPHVLVFDNSDLHRAYRLVATFERGKCLTGSRFPHGST